MEKPGNAPQSEQAHKDDEHAPHQRFSLATPDKTKVTPYQAQRQEHDLPQACQIKLGKPMQPGIVD